MKIPHLASNLAAIEAEDEEEDDNSRAARLREQLREQMLQSRLAQLQDTRAIWVVTIPFADSFNSSLGDKTFKKGVDKSETKASWAMHWAIKVGEHYYELQRGYTDPTLTGLKVSQWDEDRKSKIQGRFYQGDTAMTDREILDVGKKHFSKLNKMHINKYDIWRNNCQVAVDMILRDIGGLLAHRNELKNLHEWLRAFFCQNMMKIVKKYYHGRGCDEAILMKYEKVLHNALMIMTSRSMHYPKRQWIREDIHKAEGVVKTLGTVRDHWFLTVLESSLCLRKGTETSYVRRGPDGKPELNFEAMREAVKGIFDDQKATYPSWLKAIPWLAAGAVVGTLNWAVAVITIAVHQVHQYADNRRGVEAGMNKALFGLGISPKIHDSAYANPDEPIKDSPKNSRPRARRAGNSEVRKTKSKTQSLDNKLVARYEQRFTDSGAAYFYDHIEKEYTWDAPDQQELCLKIIDPPLGRKWEEKQEGDRVLYTNLITEETTDVKPGGPEIWAIKKRVKPDWVKATMMALPHGWEMKRTEDGEKYYLNQNDDPPTSTKIHPMRHEIEDERIQRLPEWNVEWDEERGKKYRNLETGEIRWKAIDGPYHSTPTNNLKKAPRKSLTTFVEPLPTGWAFSTLEDGTKIYENPTECVERRTHPLNDKRRKLYPEWEMRYTPGGVRYWVHFGSDGRGTTWWTRNKLLKNTSLKNDARGWKLAKNGVDWEWFEGGDVPHSEIPVLDLDDPADIEFREYPFLLPKQLTDSAGNFIEPLPQHWVLRTPHDGKPYFWNFWKEIRSDEHPNAAERRDLPGLWEMRYTRHGRAYYIDHADKSTWWTHPKTEKHEQKRRARPGQGQDGWKIAEDGKSWERFKEEADKALAEQTNDELARIQSGDSDSIKSDDGWRSAQFTKEWLAKTGAQDFMRGVEKRMGDPAVAAVDLVADAGKRVGEAKARFDDSEAGKRFGEAKMMLGDSYAKASPKIGNAKTLVSDSYAKARLNSPKLSFKKAKSPKIVDHTVGEGVAEPITEQKLVEEPTIVEEPEQEQVEEGGTGQPEVTEPPLTIEDTTPPIEPTKSDSFSPPEETRSESMSPPQKGKDRKDLNPRKFFTKRASSMLAIAKNRGKKESASPTSANPQEGNSSNEKEEPVEEFVEVLAENVDASAKGLGIENVPVDDSDMHVLSPEEAEVVDT